MIIMDNNLRFLVLFAGCNIVLLFGEVVCCNKTELEGIQFAAVKEFDSAGNSSVLTTDYEEQEFSSNSSITDNCTNLSHPSTPKMGNNFTAKLQALNLSDACIETAERMNTLNKFDSCGGVLVDTEYKFKSSSTPQDCNWLVCNDYGKYFRFVAFYMSKECDKYYFDVCIGCQFTENGSNLERRIIHKFCGKSFLSELVSFNQIIVVEYKMAWRYSSWELAAYQLLKNKPDCVFTSYAENGTIVSPEYPDSYPGWILCTWTIIAPMGHRIIVTAIDFHMQGKSSCPYEDLLLQIWDGAYEKYPIIKRFDQYNPLPATFISNSNSIVISSRPRFCGSVSRRFKLNWKFLASGCNETLRVSSGVISYPSPGNLDRSELRCNWKIVVNPGSIIRLAFSEFWATTFEASCDEDYLEITDIDIDGNDTSKLRYSNCRDPPGAIYTTSNEATVSLIMSSREYKGTPFLQLRFTAVCTRSLSGYNGTIESINYPHFLPPHLNCVWTINAWNNGSVFINLTKVDLNYFYHSLQIFEPMRDASWGEIGCLMDRTIDKTPATCTSTGKTVLVELKTSSQMHYIGTGFRLEWKVPGCSKIIRSKQGDIQSNEYPIRYPLSEVCEWTIVMEPGSTVELTIHDWEIENSTYCKFDSFKVFSGPPHISQPILHFCGTNQYPSILTAQLNKMYIQFYSDDSLSFKGFRASFKQLTVPNSSITCGQDHVGPTGFIYSPNFPNPYNNFDNCRWTVTVHDNYLAALKVLRMDIEDYGCQFDNLTHIPMSSIRSLNGFVYNGKQTAEKPNKVLCGKKVETHVVSTSNVMTVTFQTDFVGILKGFKSLFYQACGARLNRDSGIIQSPDFLSIMNGAGSCNWTIIASASKSRIVLLFTDFNWPVADSNCSQHYIEVLDGTGRNTSIFKGCCNHPPPVSIISSSNVLTLRTKNAEDLVFKAFYFTVTEDCLSILNTTRSSTMVTGISNFSTEEMKLACRQGLNATVENKQTVNVQFRLYQPELHAKYCESNFVAVHGKGFLEQPTNISCSKKRIPTIENAANYYLSVFIMLDGASNSDVAIMSTGKNTSFNSTNLSEKNLPMMSGRAAGNTKVIAVFMLFMCMALG